MKIGKLLALDVPFVFFGTQLHARDQATEVLIPFARFHQQWIAPAECGSDFEFEIPFILTPRILLPPIARGAPGSRSGENFAAHATHVDARGLIVADIDAYGFGWAGDAQRGNL